MAIKSHPDRTLALVYTRRVHSDLHLNGDALLSSAVILHAHSLGVTASSLSGDQTAPSALTLRHVIQVRLLPLPALCTRR